MPPLLVVRDLSVAFAGGAMALRGVSLAVERGSTVVLLGRSGAGKSTLLRCLNRLQVPTSGAVRAEDYGDLADRAALRIHRRRTGMVFQHHHLLGRSTALDNVLTGRIGFHPWARTLLPWPRADVEKAMECLARVGLAAKALQRADRLSGGERQRVGIARALAQEPRLVLADEPVASLDPATARSVMDLLRRVCREDGITAVLSLHQIALARRYGERVVGLAHGRVVFDGPPAALDRDAVRAVYGTDDADAGEDPAASPLPFRSPDDADPETLLPRAVL